MWCGEFRDKETPIKDRFWSVSNALSNDYKVYSLFRNNKPSTDLNRVTREQCSSLLNAKMVKFHILPIDPFYSGVTVSVAPHLQSNPVRRDPIPRFYRECGPHYRGFLAVTAVFLPSLLPFWPPMLMYYHSAKLPPQPMRWGIVITDSVSEYTVDVCYSSCWTALFQCEFMLNFSVGFCCVSLRILAFFLLFFVT